LIPGLAVSRLACVLALLASAVTAAITQTSYPDRPIRIINPFPARSIYVGRLIAN